MGVPKSGGLRLGLWCRDGADVTVRVSLEVWGGSNWGLQGGYLGPSYGLGVFIRGWGNTGVCFLCSLWVTGIPCGCI